MADKIHRIEQLALKQNEPRVAESIEDTILDLVVYMAIYESGKDRDSMESLTSPSRLQELVEWLEEIAIHPEACVKDLQIDLGQTILSDFTLNYIVDYLTAIIV